ncbi:N-myristoyl transferase [Mycena polygramma]|nr:N-myristoyl transferase [Mycena polygramma]
MASKSQEINDSTRGISSDSDSDSEIGSTWAQPEAAVPSTSSSKKKKKKSKAAKVEGLEGLDGETNEDDLRQALDKLKLTTVVQGRAGQGSQAEDDADAHKFWATQPVPQIGEGPPLEDGYIEPSKPREEVRQEPYPLPKDFEWSTVDISDPTQASQYSLVAALSHTIQNKEVYDLLSMHYVEDDGATLRFQYTAEYLQWALRPPGYFKEWHVGVRVSSNKKLVAFISGVPITLRVRGKVFTASEINYLCIHKKLRSKRLSPVLIKEVTRQVHLQGIFQAIYTVAAQTNIPTLISVCRYYHRSLNIPKLLEIGFTYVPRNMTAARMIRVNKVPDTPTLNVRPMEEKDLVPVAVLFTKYMRRFDMVPVMSLDDVRHQLLSGQGTGNIGDGGEGRRVGQVTWTCVVENPETHKITDFFSMYSLPSTILHNPKHRMLEAAYLYYYATDVAFEDGADEDGRLKERLQTLVGDALVVATQAGFDVFNALTLLDNVPILKDLKFGPGDGFLNFYLYNWRTAKLAGVEDEGAVKAGRGVGVVML